MIFVVVYLFNVMVGTEGGGSRGPLSPSFFAKIDIIVMNESINQSYQSFKLLNFNTVLIREKIT